MTPTQEQIQVIKDHKLNMMEYLPHYRISNKKRQAFRDEIDKCTKWLSIYDNPRAVINLQLEDELRLLLVKNFIENGV